MVAQDQLAPFKTRTRGTRFKTSPAQTEEREREIGDKEEEEEEVLDFDGTADPASIVIRKPHDNGEMRQRHSKLECTPGPRLQETNDASPENHPRPSGGTWWEAEKATVSMVDATTVYRVNRGKRNNRRPVGLGFITVQSQT